MREPVAAEAPGKEAEPEGNDLKQQIEELVDVLADELRDNPMLTGLAIFAAGILVGRLMR